MSVVSVHKHNYEYKAAEEGGGVACNQACMHSNIPLKIICIFMIIFLSFLHLPHSRDDQRGGEEQRSQQAAPAVRVLPLALVHLTTAVVAAAAHAEEEPHNGHEDGEE